MASISVSNITETSAKITVDGTNWLYIQVVVREDFGNLNVVYEYAGNSNANSWSHTVRGLEPDSWYAYNFRVGNESWLSKAKTFKTKEEEDPEPEIDIDKFDWYSTTRRNNALTALVNRQETTNFHYSVWNDLVDKVKEILDETGDRWDSSYKSYTNTRMSSSDCEISASKFNSLVYNIESHYKRNATGIGTVSKDDPVNAWYFTTIARVINEWIDSL